MKEQRNFLTESIIKQVKARVPETNDEILGLVNIGMIIYDCGFNKTGNRKEIYISVKMAYEQRKKIESLEKNGHGIDYMTASPEEKKTIMLSDISIYVLRHIKKYPINKKAIVSWIMNIFDRGNFQRSLIETKGGFVFNNRKEEAVSLARLACEASQVYGYLAEAV